MTPAVFVTHFASAMGRHDTQASTQINAIAKIIRAVKPASGNTNAKKTSENITKADTGMNRPQQKNSHDARAAHLGPMPS